MKYLACVALFACGGSPAAPVRPIDPTLVARIDKLAQDLVDKTPAASVSVAVTWHGQPIVAKGYGLADVEAKTPATADTVYRIGSITKQFAAAAILQLAKDHKLSIDDDVTRYLSSYPTRGQHITLRNMLQHTSGIHDFEHGEWFTTHMGDRLPAVELVASFAAEPLDFPPGTKWAYSNSAYFLLGQIIEQASKQSFADYVRDHELEAAGVTGVRYCPDDQTYPNAAKGYSLEGANRTPARPVNMAYAFSAGAMCATASGLVAWSQALSHGKVVSDDDWRAMITPGTLANGRKTRYGFGLFVGELGGHRMIFHSGGISGFVAWLAYFPDDDLHVAVTLNTEGPFATIGEDIARLVLNAPKPAVVDLPIDPQEAKAAVGTYAILGVGTLVIEVDKDQLFLRAEGAPGHARMQRQADGSYVVPEASLTLRLVRDGDRVVGVAIETGGMTIDGDRK